MIGKLIDHPYFRIDCIVSEITCYRSSCIRVRQGTSLQAIRCNKKEWTLSTCEFVLYLTGIVAALYTYIGQEGRGNLVCIRYISYGMVGCKILFGKEGTEITAIVVETGLVHKALAVL